MVKGDVATLEKQTSDDYSLINMNGQMSGKAQMVSAFKSGQTKLTSDELSDMKVRVYGNTAVITGKADVKGTLGGKDATGQIMFTRVSTDPRLESLTKRPRGERANARPFSRRYCTCIVQDGSTPACTNLR
jgi:ribosomal protein S6E (S10)